MPLAPKHPCGHPGCGALVERGKSRCKKHQSEVSRQQNALRPTVTAQGYGHTWRKLRRMVLNRNPLCAECGAIATEVDHIVPRKNGGENVDSNLRALCKPCHSRKTMRETRRRHGNGSVSA